MKMITKIITIVSVILFTGSGCSNLTKHLNTQLLGENLITPEASFLADWVISVHHKQNYHSRRWLHQKHGSNDSYIISVTKPISKNIAYYRRMLDEPGQVSCSDFSSITLSTKSNSHYPNEIWQTNCIKSNGEQAQILHAILQGKDSVYHLQKIWQGQVILKDIKKWQWRFNQVYICDSRVSNAQCPPALL